MTSSHANHLRGEIERLTAEVVRLRQVVGKLHDENTKLRRKMQGEPAEPEFDTPRMRMKLKGAAL